MPSVKLYSEVNRLKAWVKRLKRSVALRDERIETLTAEGLGLQESLTVVGEERDRLAGALDETVKLIMGCPACRESDIFPLFPGASDAPPENQKGTGIKHGDPLPHSRSEARRFKAQRGTRPAEEEGGGGC